MLEFTNKTIHQIAWAIGYEDPGSFRKVFHRVVGLSPRRFAAALSAAVARTPCRGRDGCLGCRF
jgi:transcriptional regulator GlxA family with amidase domain